MGTLCTAAQRHCTGSWLYPKRSTDLYLSWYPFLGVDPPPSLPSTPPTLPCMQALNKHYRKKVVNKDFGVHGVFEGTLLHVRLEENGGAKRRRHGIPEGGRKGTEREP